MYVEYKAFIHTGEALQSATEFWVEMSWSSPEEMAVLHDSVWPLDSQHAYERMWARHRADTKTQLIRLQIMTLLNLWDIKSSMKWDY